MAIGSRSELALAIGASRELALAMRARSELAFRHRGQKGACNWPDGAGVSWYWLYGP